MTAIKLLAVLLGLALIGAATARADAAYDACLKTANTNADFNDCGAAYLKRAEAALDAAWKHTCGLADGQTAKDLLAAGLDRIQGEILHLLRQRGAWPRGPGALEERTKDLVGIGKNLAQ